MDFHGERYIYIYAIRIYIVKFNSHIFILIWAIVHAIFSQYIIYLST